MRIIGGIAGVVVVLVVVVVLGMVGLVWHITWRALPHDSSVTLAGLDGPVDLVRDRSGIVTVYADTPHDLFFGQGYAHARDRMWQMEVFRHISSGRLSELFGASEIDTDRFIRTLGWRAAAERDWAVMSPGTRAAVQAYADGVNAWLDQNRGSLNMAFVVTGLRNGTGDLGGYDPEPWDPIDSAAWQKAQAWSLGGNFDVEILRTLLDEQLGDPARTDELTPPYRADAPVIAPSDLLVLGGTAAASTDTAAATGSPQIAGSAAAAASGGRVPLDQPAVEALLALAETSRSIARIAALDAGDGLLGSRGLGSNNWVVAPSKSATGRALLANDPHLGISMPSIWFINGLRCRTVDEACPFDVAGVSFPGSPAVILGHNARIAWGATNVGPDVQDVYIEKPDPADPGRYLFRGESLPFTTRTELIRVAGADPVTLEVRETVHGPIVNDVDERLADLPDLYAVRWTATAEPDTTLEAFLALDTAAGWDDFRAALALFRAPSQNFVYADVDGHIGYQMPGWIPIRAQAGDGSRPVPGWDGEHEWTDRVPYDALPRLYDPPTGWIVTANNAVVDEGYPYFISSDWDPGDRASRILERLESAAAGDGISVDELSDIQMDDVLGRADRSIPLILNASAATNEGRRVLEQIRDWDRHCGLDSLGCSAYLAFEYRLLRGIFDDDLGDLAREYVGQEPSWELLQRLLADPSSPWWDDTATPERETATKVIDAALDAAGAELREVLGPVDGRWTWGRLHRATFREATLGSSGIRPLEWYFDDGPHQVAGAAGAVNNTYYRYRAGYPDPDDPSATDRPLTDVFEVTNLPSYRLAVDLGALDEARIVITTGNGGNPGDRHYTDMIDAWIDGETFPLWWSEESIERDEASRLTLSP